MSDNGYTRERRATFDDDQACDIGIRTGAREPRPWINGLPNQSGQSLPSAWATRQDHQQARVYLHFNLTLAPLSDGLELVRFICGNHDVGTS